jgi:hypothetical protein
MLRATLATLLLALTAVAFAPASTASVCDPIIAPSPTYDQTLAAACAPADAALCAYNTAPASWTDCTDALLAQETAYATCYGYTGPLLWVPACT